MTAPFRILTVCTGNVCRSPTAAILLTELLNPIAGTIVVRSAGTNALVGSPMEPNAIACLPCSASQLGKSHVAQQMDEEVVGISDLVLALDRSHRKKILALSPRVKKKTFTLREFAELTSATTEADVKEELTQLSTYSLAEVLTASVRAARLSRNLVQPFSPEDTEDVPDPYGHGLQEFRDSFAEIETSARAISRYFLYVAERFS